MRKATMQVPNGLVDVRIADNFLHRLRGLLMRPPLQAHEALLIRPCNSVHTLGMRYPIDVVYLDENAHVVRVVCAMRPYRFSACFGARGALELRAGLATQLGLHPGARLQITF